MSLEEYIKICDPVLIARLKIPIAHGQLVKVAEHGHIQFLFRIHNYTSVSCWASVLSPGLIISIISGFARKSNRFSKNASNICQF